MGFCQTYDLTPKLIGDDFCFDSLQIRFIAREVYQSPIKDSIIKEQKETIKTLEEKVEVKREVIKSKDKILKSDSLIIDNLKEVIKIEKEDSDIKIKAEKNKSKKVKLIAIAEGILLFILLIVK